MAVITVVQPSYAGVAPTLKQLAKARQLPLSRIEAIDLVAARLKQLTAHKSFDGPCELLELINAEAKRDYKFGAALDLLDFER